MRVLILNWRDISHPLAGGAEQSLHEHAKFWQSKGADITWVSSAFKNGSRKEKIDGINIERFGSHYTVHVNFFIRYLLGNYRNTDVIIDSFHFIPFFTPLYVKNKKTIGLINEIAGDLWYSNIKSPFSFIGSKVEPLFFKVYNKNKFITASNSTKKDLINLGINSKNIFLVPHGVTLPKKLPKEKKETKPTIIYCSRITKDKGIVDALKSFKIINDKNKDCRMWIVGKEEKKGYLEESMSKLAMQTDNIKYFGFVSDQMKFKLLQKAWVLVHPSQKEGWGLNVIEANSVGTPAVGYDVEGLRDSIIDKKTGLLSDTNPKELAKKLNELIDNDKMKRELSVNALKWSKEFSWEKSGKKSWELVRKISLETSSK